MISITARINHRIEPMNRGDLYDDPLEDMLTGEKLGGVTGGGTSMQETGEVEFADVEIDLAGDSPELVQRVIEFLEEAGAPMGSKIILHASGAEIAFGKREGLALYMNGTDLPDEVYENGDINDVVDDLDALLEGVSSFDDFWEGPTETAMYAYGDSFDQIKAIIEPYVAEKPICQLARIVRIA